MIIRPTGITESKTGKERKRDVYAGYLRRKAIETVQGEGIGDRELDVMSQRNSE